MGLGLVTALRFTRTLSNGPEIQNEKWLWTDYSRLDIKHLLRWDLSPFPVHGVDSRCWHQFRNALYVAGTCFTRTSEQLWSQRHLVNRARNDVLHKNQEKLFSIRPAPYPRKSPTGPLQSTPHPPAQMAGLVPSVARGLVIGPTNWTVHQWQFSSIRGPFSLASSRCVPPLSCCFRFLLKFSPLRKFTATGAGYGLLTTSNPVGSIMFLQFWKLLTKIKAPRRCKVPREGVFYVYRNYQFSAFLAGKDTLPTPCMVLSVVKTTFEKCRQKWTFKAFCGIN